MQQVVGAWLAVGLVSMVWLPAEDADAQLLDRASGAIRGDDRDERPDRGPPDRDPPRDDEGGRDREEARRDREAARRDREEARRDREEARYWRDGGSPRRSYSYSGASYASSSYVSSAPVASGGSGICLGCEGVLGAGRPYDEHWYEDRGSRLGIRIDGEAGYAIAGAARGALGVRAELGWLHLFARYAGYLDPGGEQIRGALFGRIGVEFAALSIPEAQIRIGVAARHWADSVGHEPGIDLGLSGDFFPGDPFVLGIEVAAGMVGSAFSVLARAEVGVMVDSTEIFATYHYESLIGERTYADLGGMMLGLRAWL